MSMQDRNEALNEDPWALSTPVVSLFDTGFSTAAHLSKTDCLEEAVLFAC